MLVAVLVLCQLISMANMSSPPKDTLQHGALALQLGAGVTPITPLWNQFSQFNNRQRVDVNSYSTYSLFLGLHYRLRNDFALIAGCASHERRSSFDIRIQDINNDPNRSYTFQLNNTTRFLQPYIGLQKAIASWKRTKWVVGYSYGFSLFSKDGKTAVDEFSQGDKTIAALNTISLGLYQLHSMHVQWLFRYDSFEWGVNAQIQRYNRRPFGHSITLYPQTTNEVNSFFGANQWQFPLGVVFTKYF